MLTRIQYFPNLQLIPTSEKFVNKFEMISLENGQQQGQPCGTKSHLFK